MLTVFLVHGTGVRRQAYYNMYGLIHQEFARRFPKATLRTCYWGDQCGARYHHHRRSIPGLSGQTRALADDAEDIHLWARLYDDPLYEVVALAALPLAESDTFVPGAGAVDAVVEGFRRWEPSPDLAPLATQAGIAADLRAARDAIVRSDEFNDGIAQVRDPDAEELAQLLARATVAMALQMCTSRDEVPRAALDDELRDRVVGALAAAFAGRREEEQPRGLGGALSKPVTSVLSRGGTIYVQLKRDDVFDSAGPVAGDVVLYQARMEPFHQFIAAAIDKEPRPLVLLTHSLGGVMSFDMLALAAKNGQTSGVDLLITVGSQAPFLYELGASRGLLPDEALPAGFPDWLNIYAARDFLSYKAGDLFPAAKDVEVDIRQPFPRSHSAYWVNDGFWDALAAEFTRRQWV
jgi:hypothetical protein